MNPIQRAAIAVVALTITLVGSTLATAPLALADIGAAALHHEMTSVALSPTAAQGAPGLRQG